MDTSPRAPWGRPLTVPGASTCALRVAWQSNELRYPALLDPTWVSTQDTRVHRRTRHTATALDQVTALDPTASASTVLIVGGFDEMDAAVSEAELYQPQSRRFTVTGRLGTARGAHTATTLTAIGASPGTSASPVLIAGGRTANTPTTSNSPTAIRTLEVYDPDTGQFVTDANAFTLGRYNHTATLFADRAVLLAGGMAGGADPRLDQPTNTAYVYTFTSLGAGGSALTSTTNPGKWTTVEDGICGFTKAESPLPSRCIDEIECTTSATATATPRRTRIGQKTASRAPALPM